MSTESDHNDPNGAAAADDPFAGWAEALEEIGRASCRERVYACV